MSKTVFQILNGIPCPGWTKDGRGMICPINSARTPLITVNVIVYTDGSQHPVCPYQAEGAGECNAEKRGKEMPPYCPLFRRNNTQ